MAEYLIQSETLTALADAIRNKTGKTGAISLTDFASEVEVIETGVDTSDATASASDMLSGKTAYVNGEKIIGTIPSEEAITLIPSEFAQTAISAGTYASGDITVDAIPSSYVQMNFNVVGSTTEPTSPSENMIWVNTDVEISDWLFSADEPENPTEGMVWFFTGTTSPTAFNALKKNGIMVYPLSAKQYVSGAWMDKTVESYQGGAWVDRLPEGTLYLDGNENTDITGGWQARALAYNYGVNGVKPTLKKNASTMTATIPTGTTYRSGIVEINNNIDLTKYSKLYIDWEGSNTDSDNDYALELAVGNRNETYIDDAKAAYVNLMSLGSSESRQISELSITKISGYRSVFIVLYAILGKTQITVYKVWLE